MATKKPSAPASAPSLTDLVSMLGGPKTAKASASTAPFVPSSPKVIEIVDRFIGLHQRAAGIEAALKTVKAELNSVAAKPFFTENEGQRTPSSGVLIKGSGLNVAEVLFTSRYPTADVSSVQEVIGSKMLKTFFYEKLSVKIDGDKIGDTLDAAGKVKETAEAKRTALLTGLIDLFQKHDAMESISASIVVTPRTDKSGVNFHVERHTELDAEKNLKLHDVLPCVQQVRVKATNPAPVVQAEITDKDVRKSAEASQKSIDAILTKASE